MTPVALADLHARAFAPERGWSASEFETLCSSEFVTLYTLPHAFALLRVVCDEAELLTLAVDPARRRRGLADRLMRRWMADCQAQTAFLEVAADNSAARALYAKHGFAESGRRKGYYARTGAPAADAVLMQVVLTRRHREDSSR